MSYLRFPTLLFGAGNPFEYAGPMMAVGSGGLVAYSEDTVTWDEKPIGVPFNGSGWFVGTFNDADAGLNLLTNDGAGNMYLAAHTGSDLSNTKYVFKSTNGGSTWTPLDTSTWGAAGAIEDGAIGMLKFANGRLYLYGFDSGLNYTTDEGANWTNCTIGSGFNVMDIVYDGTAYVIVGSDGSGTKIQRSTDGDTFSNVTHTQQSGDSFRAAIVGSSRIVTVGWDGRTAYSTNNGSNWTNVQLGSSSTADATGICWTGAEYVVCTGGSAGEIHRSTDATAWTRTVSGTTYSFGGIVWDGSLVVAAGIINSTDKTIAYTSADGTASSFTQRNTDTSFSGGALGISTSITYDSSTDELCIAAGLNASGGECEVQCCSDPTSTWTKGTLPNVTASAELSIVRSNGSRFIVADGGVGAGNAMYYTDDGGDSWTKSTLPAGQIAVMGLHYVSSLSLWVAHLFNDTGNVNQFYSSTDGATWTARTNMSLSFVDPGNFADNGSGTIVYVGYNSSGSATLLYSSANGTSWTARTPGNSFVGWFRDVIFADGLFVAVGGDGGTNVVIQTSSDGTTWTERLNTAAPSGGDLAKVRYNWDTDTFIAFDYSGNTFTSSDGTTWSAGPFINDFGLGENVQDLDASSPTSDAFFLLRVGGSAIERSLAGSDFDAVFSGSNFFNGVYIEPQ